MRRIIIEIEDEAYAEINRELIRRSDGDASICPFISEHLEEELNRYTKGPVATISVFDDDGPDDIALRAIRSGKRAKRKLLEKREADYLYEAALRERALKQYRDSGTVTCKCSVCGRRIALEPDADTGFCSRCKRVQPVVNPLLKNGLI